MTPDTATVDLTAAQQRVVDHDDGPARLTGGFRSGRTTVLRERAARLGAGCVTICAGPAAARRCGAGAVTLVDLAAGIVARHDRPRRVLPIAEQHELVRSMVAGDDLDAWPGVLGAGPSATDDRFATEVADTVLRYEASFLGIEELRTHAAAAGVAARWEELASFTDRYLARLDAMDTADEAGIVVNASLLLRDEAVCDAERARARWLQCDDFESASFATNRIVSQLAGFGGNVVVAGRAASPAWASAGGTPVHLDRFPRRFGAGIDVRLEGDFGADGRDGAEVRLDRATVLDAAGGSWDVVLVDEQSLRAPPPAPRWFDPHLLAGPDMPSDDERARRAAEEADALMALAMSRGRHAELV